MAVLNSLKAVPVPILLPIAMAGLSYLYTIDLAASTRLPVATVLVLIAFIGLTHTFTHMRYSYQLSSLSTASSTPRTPPAIPYTLPFLGSALEFLAPRPGQYWRHLFATHPRSTGACTLLLGGMTTHVLFDPLAVQALFRAKNLNRDKFNEQIALNSFQMSKEDVKRFHGTGDPAAKERQEEMNSEFLLKTEAVNDLTREFVATLEKTMDGDERLKDGQTLKIGIMEWLRLHMFKASTVALFGDRMLEIYPNLTADFWVYDRSMLSLFFGLPRIIAPKPFEALETCAEGMLKVQKTCQKESGGQPEDPKSERSWEPIWGSRLNRARQEYYEERGVSDHGRAAMDLGLLFGLSSNAIPASGWTLMHLLDPNGDKTVLPRVMNEIESAQYPDGSLDISRLVALPLLQSILQEVLRLYTDVLVSREAQEDLILPVNDGKKNLLFRGGSNIMAPSYLGHYDAKAWTGPPCENFYAERFIKVDPQTGKKTFSMSGTTGKLFPFGGGRTMCPGRVFAKQEVLGAVAMTLLKFNFEPLGYVDLHGRSAASFPGLAEQYGGSGIMTMDGDVMVKITSRRG